MYWIEHFHFHLSLMVLAHEKSAYTSSTWGDQGYLYCLYFHGHPFSTCWGISVQSGGPTDRAMLFAWLNHWFWQSKQSQIFTLCCGELWWTLLNKKKQKQRDQHLIMRMLVGCLTHPLYEYFLDNNLFHSLINAWILMYGVEIGL